jgi:hypothetical protein
MILLLASLFVIATAIGSYVALSIAAAFLDGDREQPAALGSPHAQL